MTKFNGIIVGVDNNDKENLYRVVFYINTPDGYKYKKQLMTESEIVSGIKSNWLCLDNAEVSNNKLKGTTGELSRFNKGDTHPLVILSEIYVNDILIGYRLVTYEGVVKTARVKDVLAYCNRVYKRGVPIQNAMFVPETRDTKEHIRAYPYQEFRKEVIERRPCKNVVGAKINKGENEKQVSRLEELFNKEQIRELKLGKNHGVDIKIYGNNKLSAEQMQQLRIALEDGINAKQFADPAFEADVIRALRINAKCGADIGCFINPKYNANQIFELGTGYLSGVDISQYADPNISANDMAKTRVYLESQLWKEEKAEESAGIV